MNITQDEVQVIESSSGFLSFLHLYINLGSILVILLAFDTPTVWYGLHDDVHSAPPPPTPPPHTHTPHGPL